MEPLVLLLSAMTISVIPAQKYRGQSSIAGRTNNAGNPNDEPFLPIYPIYPYSPKLMKRGTDRDLSPELYVPKFDARDTYASNFISNYPHSQATLPSVYSKNQNYGSNSASSYNAGINNPYAGSGYSAQTYTNFGPNYSGFYPAGFSSPYPGGFSTPYPYTNNPGVAPYPASPYGSSPNPYNGPQNGYNSGPASTYTSAPASYTSAPSSYTSGSPPFTPGPAPGYGAALGPFTPAPNPYGTGMMPYPAYPFYPYYPAYPGGPPNQDFGAEESPESDPDEPETKPKKSEKKNRYNDKEENKDSIDGNFLSSKDLDTDSSSYKSTNQVDGHIGVRLTSGLPRTSYRVISLGGHPVDYPLPQNYAKVQQLEQLMSQTIAKMIAQQTNNRQQTGSYEAGDKNPGVIAKTGLAYVFNGGNLSKNFARPANYQSGANPVIIKVQDPIIQSGATLLSKINKFSDSGSQDKNSGIYIPPEAKDIVKDSGSYDYDSNSPNYEGNSDVYKKNEQNYSVEQNGAYSSHVTSQPNYSYSNYGQGQSSGEFKPSSDDVAFGKRNSRL